MYRVSNLYPCELRSQYLHGSDHHTNSQHHGMEPTNECQDKDTRRACYELGLDVSHSAHNVSLSLLTMPQCYRSVGRTLHSILLPLRAHQFGPNMGHRSRNINRGTSCSHHHRLCSGHQRTLPHVVSILEIRIWDLW